MLAIATEQQMTVAHALASAFYHFWSQEPLTAYAAAKTEEGYILADVYAIARTADTIGPQCGAYAPVLDTDGNIFHCTGTGRLCWSIDREGDVVITVHRPTGQCARIEVMDRRIVLWETTDEYLHRHDDAALEAVSALVPEEHWRAFRQDRFGDVEVYNYDLPKNIFAAARTSNTGSLPSRQCVLEGYE